MALRGINISPLIAISFLYLTDGRIYLFGPFVFYE